MRRPEDAVVKRAAKARVARLATLDSGGWPHVIPCCFAICGDTVYSAVDDKPKRSRDLKRLANVEWHPQVELVVDHYDEDWAQLWWIRIRGHARVVHEGLEHTRAVDLLAEKYPQYRQLRPTGPVLAVDIARWRSWGATTAPG